MYNAVNISFDEKNLEYYKKYNFKEINNGVDVDIIANENEKYNEIITNYNKIKNDIKDYIDIIKLYEDDLSFLESMLKKDNNYFKTLFDNTIYISLDGSKEQIIKFLKNSPELKNKKIVLNGDYNLNTELSEIEYLEKIYKDYDNIHVTLEGNKLPIKLEDFKKTIIKINNITNEIKQYNFSELEQIMYAYDIARDALYIMEEKNESALESRDLTNVLLGNKRVCEGYANIFNAILKKLNINSIVYKAFDMKNKIGHAYNAVYIDDNKYKVQGIYFFDSTFDSRKNNTNEYLYSYRAFGLNKKIIENLHGNRFNDRQTFKKYTDDAIMQSIKLINNNKIEKVDKDFIDTINRISFLISGEILITKFRILSSTNSLPDFILKEKDKISNKELIREINKIVMYMNSNINAEVLMKALYNVRKIEYYNNPEKYPFDINNLKCVVFNSRWKIMNESTLKLFRAILGEECLKNEKVKTVDDIISDNNIDLNIERIKLTKTLRKVLENNNK